MTVPFTYKTRMSTVPAFKKNLSLRRKINSCLGPKRRTLCAETGTWERRSQRFPERLFRTPRTQSNAGERPLGGTHQPREGLGLCGAAKTDMEYEG